MAAVLDTIDATRCPLCGEQNRCAMEVARETGEPQPPCWCMATDFRNAPLAALPPESRGKACICARCAAGTPASPQD
ncbi:hypothetical protein ABIC94_003081 [Variovorax paradoxus]|jgi:hypothetical protein|uniref:cysteine-rich CWC family protein n=1 Tax=Variovorax paradoxus TaxID=34073 RepID=UPI0034867ECE